MPTHFADTMIDDAVQSIRDSDIVANEAKSRLITKVLGLGQPRCLTVPHCGACSEARRCEDRIGAILNEEKDASPSLPGSWLVDPSAA